MKNRRLTGVEANPKTQEQVKEVNGGMLLLADLCLPMRSDPLGVVRGLGKMVTCVYGRAVTYSFSDPLITEYRYSVVLVSLISILDGTALNWFKQGHFRTQVSETVLFEKVKDPELMMLNFRGHLQCRMGGKREGPIEAYPKF